MINLLKGKVRKRRGLRQEGVIQHQQEEESLPKDRGKRTARQETKCFVEVREDAGEASIAASNKSSLKRFK
jgi:hypothetical protein